ncbi:MAG TPA: DinB family protein [Isosphaeraceae bacterium]|nr:DinB family protein [Isosphaeraceae bacterium]
MVRPDSTEHAPYYTKYVELVPEDDIVTAMRAQLGETAEVLASVSEREACVHHHPYTWSIKDVVGHLTDSERVFAYRALRFARGDSAPLPGFDENTYVQAAHFDQQPLGDVVAGFEAVRRSSIGLFQTLSDVAWSRRGIANGNEVSVLALAYIIVGHERHHMNIVRRRLACAK